MTKKTNSAEFQDLLSVPVQQIGLSFGDLFETFFQASDPRQNQKESEKLALFISQIVGQVVRSVRDPKFKESLGRLLFLLISQKNWFDPHFEMDPALYVSIRPFFDFLYKDYWRVTANGLSHIPTKGRALIISNHSGTLPYDGMMVRLAIEGRKKAPREVRFLVEDFVYEFPFLGTLLERIGGVRASKENAISILEKDRLLAVFPEGVQGLGKPFSERYKLKPLGRGGAIRVALKTGSPIIPTAIIGAEEIHPMIHNMEPLAQSLKLPYIPITPTFPLFGLGGLMPLPTKWSITFGKPIHFKKHKPVDADKPKVVEKLNQQVSETIQSMIDAGLKKRKSVWFG